MIATNSRTPDDPTRTPVTRLLDLLVSTAQNQLNLTRWNLGVIHLIATLALRRAVYREPEELAPATIVEHMR